MSTTSRTLTMMFATDSGDKANISVKNCKPDLTKVKVGSVMDDLIAGQVFSAGLAEKAGAEIVERTVTKLF